MTFDEMAQALSEAKRTMFAASRQVDVMADMCAGRLRSAGVGHTALQKLKEELRNYNIHTGSWK